MKRGDVQRPRSTGDLPQQVNHMHRLVAGLLALGVLGPPSSAIAQSGAVGLSLDSLLRANSHSLEQRERGLAGPGMTLLLEAARGTQFFVIAENHYRAEIPRIAGLLFEELHEHHGYNYLAVENGPYIMRRFSEPELRGRPGPSYELAVGYPGALQFLSDEEIDLFVRVARVSGAAEPLWGVDRPFGAAHILDVLARSTTDSTARSRLEAALERVSRIEARRSPQGIDRWITRSSARDELRALRRSLDPNPGTSADSMLRALELSHATYAAFLDAGEGASTGYASNRDREEFMKRRLAFALEAAETRTGDLPRVLLKVGHWHAIRGRNWGNVFSLGGFATELGIANGARSFSLATGLVGEPEGATPLGEGDPQYAPLTAAGDPNGWRVVDFRPLRPLIHAGKVEGVTPELERWIFGFDAALLIGASRAATFDRLMAEATR